MGAEAASCSASLTLNQYLRSRIPSSTSMRLEDGGLVEEAAILLRVAEAHHPLDSGLVVPRAVQQHDLAGSGQVVDVALEVPLGPLCARSERAAPRFWQPGVEVLGDSFDGAALAGGISAFEKHHNPGAGLADPFLHLHQFRLQSEQLPRRAPCSCAWTCRTCSSSSGHGCEVSLSPIVYRPDRVQNPARRYRNPRPKVHLPRHDVSPWTDETRH